MIVAVLIGTYTLFASATAWACYLFAFGSLTEASIVSSTILAAWLANTIQIVYAHRIITKGIGLVQQCEIPIIGLRDAFGVFLAIPFALALFVTAVVAAAIAKTVQWRGITYIVRPPLRLELQQYRPFAAVPAVEIPTERRRTAA